MVAKKRSQNSATKMLYLISGRLLCCCGLGIQDWSFTLHIDAWNNRTLSFWSESWCSRICASFAWRPRVSDIYAVQPCRLLVYWRRIFFQIHLEDRDTNPIHLIGIFLAVCWWSLPSNRKKWTQCSPNRCPILHSQVKQIQSFYFFSSPNSKELGCSFWAL